MVEVEIGEEKEEIVEIGGQVHMTGQRAEREIK